MADGTDLYLLPEQDAHFRHSLPLEYWLHMPLVHDPRPRFMCGERVQVAGYKGILAGWDRSFGPGHEAFLRRDSILSSKMERIYSETCKRVKDTSHVTVYISLSCIERVIRSLHLD
jgi:hypothetical protein